MDLRKSPAAIIFEQSTLLDQAGNLTEGAVGFSWLLPQVGIKSCVLAETDPDDLIERMNHAKLPLRYFDFIQGPQDEDLRKAARDFKRQDMAQGLVVVIGNTIKSSRQAEAAKLGFVAVTNGVSSFEDFVEAGFHRNNILRSLTEMRSFFRIPRTASSL